MVRVISCDYLVHNFWHFTMIIKLSIAIIWYRYIHFAGMFVQKIADGVFNKRNKIDALLFS